MKLGGKESWILNSFIPSLAIAKITFYDTILTPEFGFAVFSGEMFYLVAYRLIEVFKLSNHLNSFSVESNG